MVSGIYSPTGPQCMIKLRGGVRDGRCIDIQGERIEPGGQLQVYPCLNQWHQLFGFGDGKVSRNATIFGTVPTHIVNALKYKGREQVPHLCFGVMGRSETNYSPWKEDENKEQFNTVDFLPIKAKKITADGNGEGTRRLKSLRLWKSKQLVTIPCIDKDAIVDFVFVPFITEDDDEFVEDMEGSETVDTLLVRSPDRIEEEL